MSQLYISHTASIKNHGIHVDENLVFKAETDLSLKAFLKEVYTHLEMDYPKFHKMDMLCKLGVLGAEFLQQKTDFSKEMALVFSNSASSLDTDRIHQESLDSYPSPATFVYTLPNIVLGEISIKHQLQSENVFFVSEQFDAELLLNYTNSLFINNAVSQALLGWIDVEKDSYNAFLCVISLDGNTKFSAETLQHAYDKNYE